MKSQTSPTSRLRKYITKHSRYVFLGDRCLTVHETSSGARQKCHGAVERRLLASVRWSRDGAPEVLPGQWPRIGESLLLGGDEAELLTSRVLEIEDSPLVPVE